MRRAIRACPASEAMLRPRQMKPAREPGHQHGASTAAPSAVNCDCSLPSHGNCSLTLLSPGRIMTGCARRLLQVARTGGHQFSADQPHPAAFGNALLRLVQQDRATADPRPVDRCLALVLGSRSERSAASGFRSLHDCFVRELKEGARPIDDDPDLLVSPCDAIVGASARWKTASSLRSRAFRITLDDLMGDDATWPMLPERLLCDAAADLRHVSPFPCAA